MTNTNCPDRETLELLLLGKLPAPQRETLGEHLLQCDACAASADTLSLQDDWTNALRTLPAPEEHPQILARAIERAKALRGESETTSPDASLATQVGTVEELAALTHPPTSPKIDPDEIRFLAPPLLPDEIGRLGHYRILQVLGVGGMGIVFRAEDPRLKRQVALKAMKPEVAASHAAKDRFLREAQFTAALEHDNIVHIYQVDEDRGVPYIAMQFLRGESLKSRLERVGRLPERDVVRIGNEIAAGLAAAHERGLIHRDIKPDNIWLEEKSDRVKILDFGLVRATGDDAGLTQSGMVMGTPRYMAPEQAQGHSVDHRCDLFSLGSVLYHLVAGQPPFAGNNLTATLMAVVHQAPQPLAGVGAEVSPELEALVLKLLAKDRAQRPQTAAEVCSLLTEFERESRHPHEGTAASRSLPDTVAFPPPAPNGVSVTHPERNSDSGRRWTARRIALAAGAGAALLLAGAIVITITNKDGTKSTVTLPEGVQADVNTAPGSKVSISQTDTASGTPSSTPDPQPGWYGWPVDAPNPAIAPFDTAQAKQHQEAWAAYLKVPVEYTNSIGMKFRLIPPGEFMMGSTPADIEAALKENGESNHWTEWIKSEGPQHKVILTQPVYLGVNEVTQSEYEKVMGANPSHFAPSGKGKEAVAGLETSAHPVEMVDWNDAAEFCAKLSKHEKLKPFYFRAGGTTTPLEGTGYRLPSEAEWEFACRAGTTTKYWIGNQEEDLMRAGWFKRNSGGRTHATGELRANPFGLYDIHGNVWEWVQDSRDATSYSQFTERPAIDPISPIAADSFRMMRGGFFPDLACHCRSLFRYGSDQNLRDIAMGFRATLTVDAVKKALAEPATSVDGVKSGWHGWPADAPKPAIAPFDAAQAKRHQEAWAAYLKIPVEYTNSIGMKFRLTPPGEFTMGSTPEEIGAALKNVGEIKSWQESIKSEAPQHKVILTQPIYLGVNEVSQAQYETVMGVNSSHVAPRGAGKEAVVVKESADYPAVDVSWFDAAEFCAKLSQQENLRPFYFRTGNAVTPLDGTGYKLPNEAEWEFGCRAGTTTKYWSGATDEDLMQTGWFRGNSGRRTHAVGELRANPFGFTDMHGNAWEWVQDGWDAAYYGQFQDKPAINPSAPFLASSLRVLRGGHLNSAAFECGSSNRAAFDPLYRHFGHVGFRVSLTVDAVKSALAERAGSTSGWHGWPADAPKAAIAPFDAAQAMRHQEEWAAYLKLPVEYTNSIGMKLRLIPPGEFQMGSTKEQSDVGLEWINAANLPPEAFERSRINEEGPQHAVTLSRPFCVGATEVTVAQFRQFVESSKYLTQAERFGAGDSNSWIPKPNVKPEQVSITWRTPGFPSTDDHPVTQVTWADAVAFCNWLSEREALSPCYQGNDSEEWVQIPGGTGYRLPTEAEWEYACRAGTTTHFSFGDDPARLAEHGWAGQGGPVGPRPVAQKVPNPFGLFDMHGNLREWCHDWYSSEYYAESSPVDPAGPDFGSDRVMRGGRSKDRSVGCRSAFRYDIAPFLRNIDGGFRVVRAPPPPATATDLLQSSSHVWSALENLSPELNSKLDDTGPHLSADGLSLLFASKRPLGHVGFELWESRRKSPDEPFGAPTELPRIVNSIGDDDSPFLSQDGLELLFASNRPGTKGDRDLYVCRRSDLSAKWGAPKNLGAQINTAGREDCPALSPDGLTLYFASNRPGGHGGMDIWSASRPSPVAEFGEPANLGTAINTSRDESSFAPLADSRSAVMLRVKGDRSDVILFSASLRDGGFVSPRSLELGEVGKSLRGPRVSSDGMSLYFHAASPRGVGAADLWRIRRIPKPPSASTPVSWHGWPADAPKPAIAPFDAAQAKQHQEEWATYLKIPVEYTNTLGMKFRLIPPGEFTMGSTAEEIAAALKDVGEDKHWQECIKSEAPQHQVILTQPIYLGVNEVTQAEYEKVMGVNPSHFAPMGMGKEAVAGLETAEHPVETVSWNDAAEFCAKLSQQEKFKPFYFRAGDTITPLDGTGYRLPSEAEWEFACRAGTATKYSIGNQHEDLLRAGWSGGNSRGRTHVAGELKANPFGLSDIHGNVWEWVQDGWDATYYGQFPDKPAINPNSPFSAGSERVTRGGGWFGPASYCRSSSRHANDPSGRFLHIGFRVSLPANAVREALAR